MLSFAAGSLSLSTVFSRFISVAPCVRNVLLFMAEKHPIV